MIGKKGLVSHLKIIGNLLKKEKVALTHNDVDKISEIIEKKNEQIEALKTYKGIDIDNSKEIIELIEELNSMQELNLMLTNQALSYQGVMLESISKSINSLNNTYSSQGKYEKGNNISIIDQSV